MILFLISFFRIRKQFIKRTRDCATFTRQIIASTFGEIVPHTFKESFCENIQSHKHFGQSITIFPHSCDHRIEFDDFPVEHLTHGRYRRLFFQRLNHPLNKDLQALTDLVVISTNTHKFIL